MRDIRLPSKMYTMRSKIMINRIWNGEVGLGWAFWGIGLGGFAFPLGVLLFWWMLLGEGASFSFANLLFIVLGLIPTVVVWRTASRGAPNFWKNAAKGVIFFSVLSGFFIMVLAPIGIFVHNIGKALTPEFYENTSLLTDNAPAFFRRHTGIEIPEGAKVAHAVYYRRPVMDYEFGLHVILDASKLNLREWIKTARPFGEKLKITKPDRGLEWNAEGLKCNDVNRSEAKFTMPICDLSEAPIWHIKHRLRLDRVVTLTVLEDHNLIWLYETSW